MRPNFNKNLRFTNMKTVYRVSVILALIALVALLPKMLQLRVGSSESGSGVVAGTQTDNAIAINKAYTFNARNNQGGVIDKKPMKLSVTSAEVNKNILIKGQPANARSGKSFLIFNVDIDNSFSDKLYMPVNDLVRLQEGDKLRAPDVHNSLVLVDPISTKTTRIGFLVDDGAKNFILKIGEVNGEKQTIELAL